MYSIKYLPLALEDVLNAVAYIKDKLSAPTAASNLLNSLDQIVLRLLEHPYQYPLYHTEEPLGYELRIAPVRNYLLFYAVLEEEQTIELHRFIFSRMDIVKQRL